MLVLYQKNQKKDPNFEIKRNNIGEWYIFKNGRKYSTEPVGEDDIDNEIRYIKDLLKAKKGIKIKDINVIKNINDGIIKIDYDKNI